MWTFEGPVDHLKANLPPKKASIEGAYMVFVFLESGRPFHFSSSDPARKLREWRTNHPAAHVLRVLAAGRFRRPTRVSTRLQDLVTWHTGPSAELAAVLLEAMQNSPELCAEE